MNTATYNVDDLDSSKVFPPPDVTGTFARFGDEVVCYVSNREWPLLVKSAETAGFVLRKLDGDFESEQLYLAIQGGNSFVEEHPNVPVVLNKGRHLAVMLEPAQADRLLSEESPEYVVRPLKGREIVYDFYSPASKKIVPEDWISSLVASISPPNVRATLEHLASFLTRRSSTEHYLEAARWAKHRLDLLGYETRMENVDLGVETSVNIVAEKRGHGTGNRHVTVVTAHLDSINLDSPDVLASAPGADDNASGCAGVLEIARVLSMQAGRGDLRLIFFGGEEQGMVGSEHHVAVLSQAERQRIKAVINMDMIATVNTGNVLAVLLEGAPVSQHIIDGLAAAAAAHTTLVVKRSTSPGRSDHVPFIRAEIPAVLTIEGNDCANGNDHSADDTLAHINYDLLLSILRMNLAFVAKSVDR